MVRIDTGETVRLAADAIELVFREPPVIVLVEPLERSLAAVPLVAVDVAVAIDVEVIEAIGTKPLVIPAVADGIAAAGG